MAIWKCTSCGNTVTADSSQGKIVLADFQGKNVLVAFYFKDFTGG